MGLLKNNQTQTNLDANYYKRQQAYNQALEAQRIENAKAKGVADANRLANHKPFYQKVLGVVTNIGKDLVKASGNVNPDALITFDEPKERQRRKHRKRR